MLKKQILWNYRSWNSFSSRSLKYHSQVGRGIWRRERKISKIKGDTQNVIKSLRTVGIATSNKRLKKHRERMRKRRQSASWNELGKLEERRMTVTVGNCPNVAFPAKGEGHKWNVSYIRRF